MESGSGKFVLVAQVLVLAAMGALLVQVGSAVKATGEAAEAARQAAARADAAAKAAEATRASLRDDLEVLAGNVNAVERNLRDLVEQVKYGSVTPLGAPLGGADDRSGTGAPPAQPVLEFTPELRASLAAACAAKGVRLLEDRVVVPGRVVLRSGQLEYFAVFRGGKAHESIFVLTGTPDGEGRPPEGLGASLNSCLMALGLKPGTPVRMLPGGRMVPPRGTPVHIAVEWEEDGKKVRVRGEDLVWERERNRPMEPGKWIYVGSYFEPDGYVPDLSGDAVATYSVPSCIVDVDDPRAADDTLFLACTPRLPPADTKVDVVFSPKPLEPTRTWSEADARLVQEGAPPVAPGKEPGDGK